MKPFNFLNFVVEQINSLKQEWRDFYWTSPQAQLALKTALATVLAVFIALIFAIPNAFWAGISALVVTQAQVGASLHRALSRIFATFCAAWVAIVVANWIQNPFLFLLSLFFLVTLMLYQSQLSENPYVWIIAAATLLMVDVYVFIDTHQVALIADYRVTEIIIGSITAWLVNATFLPTRARTEAKKNIRASLRQFQLLVHYFFQASQDQVISFYEFDNEYKKMATLLDKQQQLLRFAFLEDIFNLKFHSFAERLFMALREASEILLKFYRHQQDAVRVDFSLWIPQWQTIINNTSALFDSLTTYLIARHPRAQQTLMRQFQVWSKEIENAYSQFMSNHYQKTVPQRDKEKCAAFTYIFLLEEINFIFSEVFTNPKKNQTIAINPRFLIHKAQFHLAKVPLTYGMKGALAVLTIPIIWIVFNFPGLDQIAVSVIAIMQIEPIATKNKGFARILGCILGAIAVFLTLVIGVSSLIGLLLAIFLFIFIFGYIHHGKQSSYIGTQAGVVFLLGMLIGLGPATNFNVVFERLSGITLGVLTTVFITQQLWPLKPASYFIDQVKEIEIRFNQIIKSMLILHHEKIKNYSLAKNFLLLRRLIITLKTITFTEKHMTELCNETISIWRDLYHDLFALHLLGWQLLNQPALHTNQNNNRLLNYIDHILRQINPLKDKIVLDLTRLSSGNNLDAVIDNPYYPVINYYLQDLLEDLARWIIIREKLLLFDQKIHLMAKS